MQKKNPRLRNQILSFLEKSVLLSFMSKEERLPLLPKYTRGLLKKEKKKTLAGKSAQCYNLFLAAEEGPG